MSVRYFKTPTGPAMYGNLSEDALRVLTDAGHEEITADEYQAEEGKQAEAGAALHQPATTADGSEQGKEATADGRDGRKRRR
jgi:hypothetical protein